MMTSSGVDRSNREFVVDLWPLIIANFILWAIVPGLFFGNLHTDTLEAAYWGRDLALGYPKHPPLLSWVLALVLQPGEASILILLIFGQIISALSTFAVWRLVRDRASRSTATLAAAAILVSPFATFYAAQINHNSMLVPFNAGVLCFGLLYLEKRSVSYAISLGVLTGLGALTKYEIIFAILPVIVMSLVIPRFRAVWRLRATYIAMVIAIALVIPHTIWLDYNGWTSVVRAVDSAPIQTIEEFAFGFWGFFWGMVATAAAPALMIVLSRHLRAPASDYDAQSSETRVIAWCLAVLPFVLVVLAAAVTLQFVKALWLLPLTPSAAAGLALFFPAGDAENGIRPWGLVSLALKVTFSLFALFWIYIFIGDVIDRPMEAYVAKTQPLADAAQEIWARHQSKPLSCYMTDEGKIGASPVLWLKSRPQILDIGSPFASPERFLACGESGGVAAVFEDIAAFQARFPQACIADAPVFRIGTIFGLARTGWVAHLIYVPPALQPDCH